MRTILIGILLSATLLVAGCTLTIEPEGGPPTSAPQTPTPVSEDAADATPAASETAVVTATAGVTGTVEATATAEAVETVEVSPTLEITATAQPTVTAESPMTGSETIDPALLGITWQWVRTDQPDGTFVEVNDPSRYTLTFMADGSVGAQFDCNSGGGPYAVGGSNMTIGPLVTTLIACPEENQADLFGQQLSEVTGYALAGDTLSLTLAGGGAMTFVAAGADTEESAAASTDAGADAGPVDEAIEDAAAEAGTAEDGESEDGESEDGAVANELTGTLWGWTRTEYGNDTTVTATDPSRYTLSFEEDGNVAVLLDCNRGRGAYALAGSGLTFGPVALTRMACPPDSQADAFAQDLENVVSYVMEGDALALSLFADGGIMFFSPLE